MVVPVVPGSTVLFFRFMFFFFRFLQIKSCFLPENRPNFSCFHTFSLTWSR